MCVSQSQGATVTAKLDSVSILMGKTAKLQLQVVEAEGQTGYFPILRDGGKPYATVCGDSVELSRNVTRDTVRLGSGKLQVNYELNVQAFDSGYYKLPELAYVSNGDTTWTKPLFLQVIPVKAEADDPIADFARESQPYGSKWTDSLPDWLYYYWWAVILGLGVIAGAVFFFRKVKKEKRPVETRIKSFVSPVDEALASLEKLREKKLWERGMEKEYFTELTDILRRYLERRFGINAMEMTSRQIMVTLRENPELKDKRETVRQILDMADFVKFAKVRPLPSDNVAAYDNAVSFVKETAPVAESGNEERRSINGK